MTLRKRLLISFLVLFIFNFSYGYTRGEMREFELKEKHKFQDNDDLQKQNQNEIKKRNTQTLGFFDLADDEYKSSKYYAQTTLIDQLIKNAISNIIDSKKSKHYKLTLKITCLIQGLPIATIPKFTSLNWSIKLSENKKIKGTFQTNENGIGTIILSSKAEMQNHLMKIERNEHSTTLKLWNGPYNINLPTEACQKVPEGT